jgi:hypothetical protein
VFVQLPLLANVRCSPSIFSIQDITSSLSIDFNDKLRLASSWFGMCGISSQISPQPLGSESGAGGVHVLKADTFDLYSFQTLTGTTFMMMTSRDYRDAVRLLQENVYRLYCDYVLKNPFYEADQVIKSSLFDSKLVQTLKHGRNK